MQWYVLKVQSNREKSIRDSLLRRIKMEGLEADFGDVVIPTEKVVETKGGKRKVRDLADFVVAFHDPVGQLGQLFLAAEVGRHVGFPRLQVWNTG